MVPRHAIRGLDVNTPGQSAPRDGRDLPLRVPVYRDSPEHIVGILALRDVARAIAAGETLTPLTLARLPLFVPEIARISRLLREFQRSRQQVAIVVNEYGGVAGLVTIEIPRGLRGSP